MTDSQLEPDLIRDEGERDTAYRDSLGIWTDGIGHAHVSPGAKVTHAEALANLHADIATSVALLDRAIPWWRNLNAARQDVLAEMCFNMGWLSADGKHGLGTFVRTLAAIHAGDYISAADMMLQSAWAGQVHQRANRLAEQMRTGVDGVDQAPTTHVVQASFPLPDFFHRMIARFA